MQICRDETFGPDAPLIRFANEGVYGRVGIKEYLETKYVNLGGLT